MAEIFERLIRAAHIKAAPLEEAVTATPAELAALAALYGLPAITGLRGAFRLRAEPRGVIAADLHMSATVTRTCVITLENFDQTIRETTKLRFIPAETLQEAQDSGGVELDSGALEAPDDIAYANGMIDLGAALAEQLALSLDPYPRKPGAMLPPADHEASENPFAKLRRRLL